MRRPLCVFCTTMLVVQFAAVYLPQSLFWILTAIFSFGMVLFFVWKRNPYAICILLGMPLGGLLFFANQTRQIAMIEPFLDETVTITARVESVRATYMEELVSATLRVDSVNGIDASFGCYTLVMPEVIEGELIEGDFLLSALSAETRKYANYGNQVFVQGEYKENFCSIGEVGGLRGFLIATRLRLSGIIRAPFSDDVGGVLAAMTVGDREMLSERITELYRRAGLSHILVVSGLHLTLLCSFVHFPQYTRRERWMRAVCTMSIAFFLAGVTGGTSSVLRAVMMLAIATVAQLCDAYADGYTSLAVAGVLLVLPNGYLVCDLSFQLSFLATYGVLLGASFARDTLDIVGRFRLFRVGLCRKAYMAFCVTSFASIITIPVLILWQMNVSLLALLAMALTFWMIPTLLFFGLVGALIGLVPFCGVLSTLVLTGAAFLTAILNKVVAWVAQLPGGALYFETEYAAIVCLAVLALGAIAYAFQIRLRVVLPCCLCVFCVGLSVGNRLMQDVIKVSLVGTSSYPAVVVSTREEAMVLFRGGEYNVQAVEEYLERRAIPQVSLVVDLRLTPTNDCAIQSERYIALSELAEHEEVSFSFEQVEGTLFQSVNSGVVRLDFGGITLATTSGTVEFTEPYQVDVLLGVASKSGSVVGKAVLCRGQYEWLADDPSQAIYHGHDRASLWIRYGGNYRLLGVQYGT